MHRADPRKKNDSVQNVSIAAAQSPALMRTGAPTSGPRGTGLCLLQPPHQAMAGAGSPSSLNDESAGTGTLRGNTHLKASLTCTQFWGHFYTTDFLQLKNLILQLGRAPPDQIPAGGGGVERSDGRVRTQDIRIKSQVFQAVQPWASHTASLDLSLPRYSEADTPPPRSSSA